MVAAENPYIAEDALSLISVEIDERPAILTWADAQNSSTLVHERAGTNIAHIAVGRGDADEASGPHPTFAASGSASSATPPSRSRRAGLWRSGTRPAGTWSLIGATKIPFFNRSLLATMLDLPESSVDLRVIDVGGWIRGARRVLSRGFFGSVHRQDARPPGQMDRGSPRAHDGDQSLARGHMRPRDRVQSRRNDPRAARRRHGRHRRLRAGNRRHRPDPLRAISSGPVSDRKLRLQRERLCQQQDAGRHLSGTGPGRGQFLSRAVDRHGGIRSHDRSRGIPPPQSGDGGRDALRHRPVGELRGLRAIRFRRFSRPVRARLDGNRLARQAVDTGAGDRRLASRDWIGVLRRERRRGSQGERQDTPRAGRHARRLCRISELGSGS